MGVFHVAAVAAVVWGAAGLCKAAPPTTEPVLYTARFNSSQTYYLEVPGGETSERSWPLVIVIHGGIDLLRNCPECDSIRASQEVRACCDMPDSWSIPGNCSG